MGGAVAAGAGVGWAGWVHAAGLGLGLGAVDGGGTAVGAGVLGALVGVRWGVGAWERAKKGWWADWDRVGEGLERDLKVISFF
jgi:hypothetical protein